MLVKSANYQTIWEDAMHTAETKIVVGNTTYGQDQIYSVSRSQSLYADNFGIGNAVVNQIEFTLMGVTPSALPKLSRVEVWTRLWNGTHTDSTNWLPMGVYYTKKPTYDPEAPNGLLSVVGYDEMYKSNAVLYNTGTSSPWTNKTLREVAVICATAMGVTLEDSTQVNELVMATAPLGYAIREILIDIAIANGGNWVMVFSDNNGAQVGKLRLAKPSDIPAETHYLVDEYGNAITFGGDRILV